MGNVGNYLHMAHERQQGGIYQGYIGNVKHSQDFLFVILVTLSYTTPTLHGNLLKSKIPMGSGEIKVTLVIWQLPIYASQSVKIPLLGHCPRKLASSHLCSKEQ